MSIQTVGIIGAGTMGNGIAQACAVSGIPVVMVDISEAAVAKGIATEKMLEDVWDIPEQERDAFKQLFRALTPLYPDRQGLQGLRPDLIGEALVAQSLLTERGLSLLDQILASGASALRRSSLTVLARLLNDREDLIAVVEEVLALLPVAAEGPVPLLVAVVAGSSASYSSAGVPSSSTTSATTSSTTSASGAFFCTELAQFLALDFAL